MPHTGHTSLVVVARLTDRKGIWPWLVESGHTPLLGRELVLLLGTSCSHCTPTGATAPSSGSWQCQEWRTGVTLRLQTLIPSLSSVTSCKMNLMLLLPVLPTR